MNATVTIRPGVSPRDRGYVEDLLTDAIASQLGGAAGCPSGGTLLGADGGMEESDFQLEWDGADPLGLAALCREVLGGIPFTMPTVVVVAIDDLDPFEVHAGGES